ncbi:hypothetical protein FA15DRAFT_704219 [Coprinopsis marcescibilis]|uniref:Uncharacterized protein n=1 Tax=Coprinopsis marcescibilis TaxID=230819 RepID=A0A5C3KX42_COPMA|nr:hypothetical protein FA15DRAFT_704219 [Coprinopsis marcescibilis]
MAFESSLTSNVGWLSGLLFNPNNISFEAGPITTVLEHQVGQDLFANIEFIWNTISPQKHTFLMQGTDRLFLAYRPLFHKANSRQQLILEVAVPNHAQQTKYLELKREHPNAIFTLTTKSEVVLDDLRSLLSRWHDPDYDTKHTPFYLYGTPQQQHIDHMLLKAPNAQLTAENVELEFFDAKSTN